MQREVTAALADVTQARLDEETRGVDGCSIPTYAIPLRALAHGFARFATGQGLSAGRAKAAARIRAAVAAHPAVVAGAGRFDTEVMTILGARAFTKTGAEGAYCAALPELGLGLAVKADDGAGRAAQAMIAALLRRFGGFDDRLKARLAPFAAPRLTNWSRNRGRRAASGGAVGATRTANSEELMVAARPFATPYSLFAVGERHAACRLRHPCGARRAGRGSRGGSRAGTSRARSPS